MYIPQLIGEEAINKNKLIKLNGEDKKGFRRPTPMSFKGFLKAQF